MSKNQLLEAYPELWGVELDWDNTDRAIASSSLSNIQLERLPKEGESLWVKVASSDDSNGQMVRVPWEFGVTMAAALVRAIEPGKRAQWVAVSHPSNGIAVYSNTSSDKISAQEMIFVAACQFTLFPPSQPEAETKAA